MANNYSRGVKMANGRYDYDDEEQVQRVPKKADIILQRQQTMAAK